MKIFQRKAKICFGTYMSSIGLSHSVLHRLKFHRTSGRQFELPGDHIHPPLPVNHWTNMDPYTQNS